MSEQRKIEIPELSLVVLIGVTGSGKSTFAHEHFRATEILSSDACRALVADDENDQSSTKDAFEVLHFIGSKRLAACRLTVVDATSVRREDRARLVALARQFHVLPVAVVFNLPERLCRDRNAERPDRDFGPHVISSQMRELRKSLKGLQREGFRGVHILESPEQIDGVVIERTKLWNNLRAVTGPFDVIGDVHGCCGELERLLTEVGYEVVEQRDGEFPAGGPLYAHPGGRKAVFVGDLVDRGPRILDTIRLVRNMVDAGAGFCVPGNHDIKLVRALRGRDVQITHGLDASLREIEAIPEDGRDAAKAEAIRFLDGLVSHYVFDEGRLVVAHAGMKEEMQGRGSGKVRDFALYGETTGETDEFGLPVRWNWAAEYRGSATVVYGHTPVPETDWLNRTINIDTGCVFGGRLTALRYPENELVSIPADATYVAPVKPFIPEQASAAPLTSQQRQDELLDIEDVLGKRIVSTRLNRTVTIREENAIAALEVMGRFAVNPKWLVYLPPTVSPSETSARPDLLEHPAEAFAYYRHEGVASVICEEKHMGSRAVVVACRDEDAARAAFGVVGEGIGVCYTRTGRPFFADEAMEAQLLERLRLAAEKSGLFERLSASWLLLDCELMPWSQKAQELLRSQYAAVGSAATAGLGEALATLSQARSLDGVEAMREHIAVRLEDAGRYVEAYRRYCWPVATTDDLKLAPFHLLASEGAVHIDQTHSWHLELLSELAAADDTGVIIPTRSLMVDTTDEESQRAAIAWWEELTGSGGEGMVVKPNDFVVRGRRGLVQPALKCRGHDYLRIIYGPEYGQPANLDRLRSRALGAKRSLALREFAIGVEGLERFTRGEPLRRVHECAFAVLALESEPVDPRL